MQYSVKKVMNARKRETIVIILTKVCVKNIAHLEKHYFFRCWRDHIKKCQINLNFLELTWQILYPFHKHWISRRNTYFQLIISERSRVNLSYRCWNEILYHVKITLFHAVFIHKTEFICIRFEKGIILNTPDPK